MKVRWKARTAAATVYLPEPSAQGVLVPGGFILTAAHAVAWDADGAMTLEDDRFVVMVRPRVGPEFRLKVYAIEPVADIAVLGEPDNQVFYDDAHAFEEFAEATEPVPVSDGELAARVPVHIFTQHRAWASGTAADATDGCAWLTTTQKVEGGTSGGPVVNDEGSLVGVISHTWEEAPFEGRMPRPHRALPVWLWRQILAGQRRDEQP